MKVRAPSISRVVMIVFVALSAINAPPFVIAGQQSDSWIRFTSKEGRYSILLPSQPSVGTQEAATADGTKFTQYKATVAGDGAVFMVAYFDYAQGIVFTIDKARDGMVEAIHGTLLTERPVTLSGQTGRELRVAAKDESGTEYIIRARMFDMSGRVYVLQMITPKVNDEASVTIADRYMNSFQVMSADDHH